LNYLIIGGGISGLVSAHALLKGNPLAQITIVEKDQKLGGLLSGIEYEDENLYFDTGTHIFQETGNQELDQLLMNAVPSSDLIRFPIGEGDICGSVFNRILQRNSHFPDLRHCIESKISKSILKHLENLTEIPGICRENSLFEVSTARFGEEFTQQVITPIFEHTFDLGIDSLSAFALLLTGWTRVIIDDEREWMCNNNDRLYRSLIAIPEQRNLPLKLHHGRHSFYSNSKGSKAFIQGLATSLEKSGVKILNNCTVTSFESSDLNLTLNDANNKEVQLRPDKVIFSNGVIGAARTLGVNLTNYHFDKPMRHRVIDVLLKESCDSDLCYLLGLDQSCEWYRVTNYSAITGDSMDRRLSIEVLGDNKSKSRKLIQNCLDQLKEISFLSSSDVEFKNVRDLASGFPKPSVQNLTNMSELWLYLENLLSKNIMIGGIGAQGNLFFQNEVIEDIYKITLQFA
jgi:protoporphyrinogen oxidase